MMGINKSIKKANNILTVDKILSSLLFVTICAMLTCCSQNATENKEQTIKLVYIAWGCNCANWARVEDAEKFGEDSADSLAKFCVFVEPADSLLTLPDTLGYNGDIIQFTGVFYSEKGFPKGFSLTENAEEALVFRYSNFAVVKSNYTSE
jgi:hypothetical protein